MVKKRIFVKPYAKIQNIAFEAPSRNSIQSTGTAIKFDVMFELHAFLMNFVTFLRI